MPSHGASGLSFKRDKDHYYSDGNCLFLIEKRLLFKIHRSRLEADSIVFRDMFSLPQPGVERPGEPREEPIILHDTISDFRALCWALYATPSEIAAQMTPGKVNMNQIVSVILMAQKYEFGDLCDWAISTFDTQLDCVRVPCHDWTLMERLLQFAYVNDKNDLAKRIEETWLDTIMIKPHQGNCFVKALDAAESLNLRQFHGKAYHCYLKALGKFNSPSRCGAPFNIGSAASLIEEEFICDDLDEEQSLRLYHGFLSLTQLRNRLDEALPLADNPQCQNHVSCQRGWNRWWSNFLKEIRMTRGEHYYDPGKFFRELLSRTMTRPILVPDCSRQVYCQALIRAQVRAAKEQFEDTLADHFMIPAE